VTAILDSDVSDAVFPRTAIGMSGDATDAYLRLLRKTIQLIN